MINSLCSVITTITRIGDVLGAVIFSEIGDISRFKKANQLVAYAGLDVAVKQSGNFNATDTKFLNVVFLILDVLFGLLLPLLLLETVLYLCIIKILDKEVRLIVQLLVLLLENLPILFLLF